MEELIAQQAELIAKLLQEIEDAKTAASSVEGVDIEGARLGDCIRQIEHLLTQAQDEATQWEQKHDVLAEERDKTQEEWDKAIDAAGEDRDEELANIADHVEDLCMALGHARRPIGPTGLRELDALVAAVF